MSYVERVFQVIYYGIVLVAFVTILGVGQYLVTGHMVGADATDSAIERSGMALRTDFGTGCEYLASSLGGLTPRIGSDGRQICRPTR